MHFTYFNLSEKMVVATSCNVNSWSLRFSIELNLSLHSYLDKLKLI